jgi:hypothetical protein
MMAMTDKDQPSTTNEGTAATTIELFDNGVSLGPVTMTSPTTWTKQVSGLVAGSQHRFLARESGGIPSSDPWDISVRNKLVGYENFDSYRDQDILIGVPFETPLMTITLLEGVASYDLRIADLHFQIPPIPGRREGKILAVVSHGRPGRVVVRFQFKGSCSQFSFWHSSNFAETWLNSYDSTGELLERRLAQLSDRNELCLEEAFTGPDIAALEIETSLIDFGTDEIRLDWFRFS